MNAEGARSLLNQFKDKQRQFNKAFRQAKRQHENNSLKNLADLADKASNDPSEMWKRLKALSDRKSSSVLLEIIREDGSISTDKKEVLEKWCSDFKQCFKGMKDDPDLVFDDEFFENIKNLKAKFDKLSNDEQEAGSNFNLLETTFSSWLRVIICSHVILEEPFKERYFQSYSIEFNIAIFWS